MVAERFEIQERLGAGGFGDVYRGYDRLRESVVAIKVLNSNDPNALRRFKREFRELSQITHPNLLQLYEFFSVDSLWFFTMEHISGSQFLEYIRLPETEYDSSIHDEAFVLSDFSDPAEGDPTLASTTPYGVNYDRLHSVLSQLVEGVSQLHRSGTLHRDLKPENILIDDLGRVVLLDFGIISGLNECQQHSAGTPHFIAPEQARGEAATFATDWYSVGVILFLAMTGSFPTDGTSTAQLFLKKCDAKAPTIKDFPPSAPRLLVSLCIELLANKPDERPGGKSIAARFGETTEEIQWRIASPHREPKRTPLVGRAPQIFKLEEVLVEALENNALTLCNVKGEPGIGKTALVEEFLSQVSTSYDIAIFSGSCRENEILAFKAFDAIVDEIVDYICEKKINPELLVDEGSTHLPRLFSSLQQLDGIQASLSERESNRHASEALSAFSYFLNKLASYRPLILFIDDTQWADQDSARLLGVMSAEIHAPILLITTELSMPTSRVEQRIKQHRFLSYLDSGISLHTIALGNLSIEDSQSLALSIVGAENKTIELIARESGGNPQLIDTFSSCSGLSPNGSHFDFENILKNRIANLPEDAFSYLKIIAISGQPIAREYVKRLAHIRSDEQSIVSRLRNGGYLRLVTMSESECFELCHKRIGQAVISLIGKTELSRQHRNIAEILSNETSCCERIARHFLAAGAPQEAANFYLRTSNNLMKDFAYEGAKDALEMAIEFGAWTTAERLKMGLQLGSILAKMGRGSDAAEQYLQCSTYADNHESLELRRRAFEQLLRSGHVERGLAILYDLMQELKFKKPNFSVGLAHLNLTLPKNPQLPQIQSAFDRSRIETIWAAANILGLIDAKIGSYFQLLNHHLSFKHGNRRQVARTLALNSLHLAIEPKTRKLAIRNLELSGEILDGCEDANQHDLNYQEFHRGLNAYVASNFVEAERIFRLVCAAMKGSDRPWQGENAQLHRTYCLLMMADFRSYDALYPELVNASMQRGDLAQARSAKIRRYVCHLAADNPELALQELATVEQCWRDRERYQLEQFWHLRARTNTLLYLGRPSEANLLIKQRWKQIETSCVLTTQLGRITFWDMKVRIELALTQESKKRPKISKWAKHLIKEDIAYSDILVQIHSAQLAIFDQDFQRAEKLFANAEMNSIQAGLDLLTFVARVGGARLRHSNDEVVQCTFETLKYRGLLAPDKFLKIYMPIEPLTQAI